VRARAAASLFDGPEGSTFEAVFRDEGGRERVVRLTRAFVARTPVLRVSRASGGHTVVEFNLFTREIAAGAARAFKGELKGARGLVLDLRDNAGGEAEAMTDIASLLLPPGLLLGRFDDRAGRTRLAPRTRAALLSAADAPARFSGPVVVLTGARTASAAEVFAAALRESGRAARVVGETTCGCVLGIRRRHTLPDGGALDVSEMDYRTAAGRRLEGTGVEPDELVTPTRRSLREGKDPALARAVEILKEAARKRPNAESSTSRASGGSQ
jgi:carboxyl-terminal processing protease